MGTKGQLCGERCRIGVGGLEGRPQGQGPREELMAAQVQRLEQNHSLPQSPSLRAWLTISIHLTFRRVTCTSQSKPMDLNTHLKNTTFIMTSHEVAP